MLPNINPKQIIKPNADPNLINPSTDSIDLKNSLMLIRHLSFKNEMKYNTNSIKTINKSIKFTLCSKMRAIK
jgi:hypothetical protein